MRTDPTILRRLQEIESRLATFDPAERGRPVLASIERHVAAIRRLMHAAADVEPGGSTAHPLGQAPFQSAQILFHLDVCEESLLRPAPSTEGQAVTAESLIYPSLTLAFVRRAVARLLCLRGWLRGEAVDYDVPTVREAAYLYGPRSLRGFLAWLLPRGGRPSLAHTPNYPCLVAEHNDPEVAERTSTGKAA